MTKPNRYPESAAAEAWFIPSHHSMILPSEDSAAVMHTICSLYDHS